MLGKWSWKGQMWGQAGERRQALGPWVPGHRNHWPCVPASPQEERALSGTLEASKALLEEQLEAAQERCARLHETQRENLLLRTRLGEAHAVSCQSDPNGPPGFPSDPRDPFSECSLVVLSPTHGAWAWAW